MNEQGPLSGYRILDLADEKGRLGSRFLADMGAEVIRVEKPGAEVPSSWENLGKLGITLDIESATGQEIFKKLVKTADVLIESYQPGYLGSLGIDYPRLNNINPRLIMASITPFGQTGPYRDYKAPDIVTSALGGQAYVSGESDMPPLKLSGNQTFYTACLYAAVGIMLAIKSRHATGRGQYLDIAIQECAATCLDHILVRHFYQGVVARRQGSLHWNGAFRIFPCKDGYILLSLLMQWETLVEWLQSEGMAADLTGKKYLDNEFRQQNLDKIISVLEQWTKSHTVDELVETGQLMHFPWAKVDSIPELINSPQLNERGFFIETELPQTGKKYKVPGAPCKLSGSLWQVGNRAPVPGQDNERIYTRLGLSKLELEALAGEGVI